MTLTASDWGTISTPSRYRLANDASGNLYFDFPTAPNSMGYLYNTRPSRAMAGTLSMSIEITTTGTPSFNKSQEAGNTCDVPATVRPFFWSNNSGWTDYDRWWSNPTAVRLEALSTTINIPLTPDRWTSVNGRFGNADSTTQAAFQTALANVTRVGMTFGGGCFFGHGVDVSGGTARFTISRIAVN